MKKGEHKYKIILVVQQLLNLFSFHQNVNLKSALRTLKNHIVFYRTCKQAFVRAKEHKNLKILTMEVQSNYGILRVIDFVLLHTYLQNLKF